MHSSNSFKQDIVQLRELFATAPLIQFEAARQAVLAHWINGFSQNKAKKIFSLSQLYEDLVRQSSSSSVYTPKELVAELFEKTVWQASDAILDCSGGTGNLASPFVLAGCDVTLMDTDETALAIAEMELAGVRTLQADFLKSEGLWDVIIGNPPWEGHKTMTLAEKKELREQFPGIMGNKADLHFAFFAKAHELLKVGGHLSFIVSRYWLEAESGSALRAFLLDHFTVLYLHDWYGQRPFGAGVDPLLIVLRKNKAQGVYKIPVYRQDVGSFTAKSSDFGEDSMKLRTPSELQLRNLMEESGSLTLGEAGTFYQGIITGFDKAFILTPKEAEERGIEPELLVDWIKSSDLRQIANPLENKQLKTEKRLIYADASVEASPGFMAYIEQHRERLASRREVKNGLRRFFQLQWGRDRKLFEAKRILFPYKAPTSLFVATGNVFHSADVYSYVTEIDHHWLCTLLNHPIYDRYIKTELKKLGDSLYEYYPHRLRSIRIPDPKQYPNPDAYLKMIESKWEGELLEAKQNNL